MKSIDIFAEGKICSNFIRGNSYILKKYNNLFKDLDSDKKTYLFEELWKTEFKARFDKQKTNHYRTIVFENEIDMFLFLLKIK